MKKKTYIWPKNTSTILTCLGPFHLKLLVIVTWHGNTVCGIGVRRHRRWCLWLRLRSSLGKEGSKRRFCRLGPRFFFFCLLLLFIRFEDANANAEVPQTSEPQRQKTQTTVYRHLGRISTGRHFTQHHTSITTMIASQPPGQRDGATTGPGRVVTTKTGPNDARRVIWALIGTFFFFVFIDYTVLTNDLYCI